MSVFSTCASLPLTGAGIFQRQPDWVGLWEMISDKGSAVFLESSGTINEAGRWLILAGIPEKEIFDNQGVPWFSEGNQTGPAKQNLWEFLEKEGCEERTPPTMPHCLSSAWFGLLSYEFGKRFALREDPSQPEALRRAPHFYFFKPRGVLAFDRLTKEWKSFGINFFKKGTEKKKSPKNSFRVGTIRPQSSLENYSRLVRRAQDYISKGDIYQANLAQAFTTEWSGSPGTLYRALREINPGPFMGIFSGRGFTVVSSSPERLAAGHGDWLETRPIAGTKPRGKDNVDDLQLQWELKTNAKEQAEHLMLVDLARNDLGKVSRYGTVEVKSFARVESYARVQHLVSTIEGRRRHSAGMGEVLRAFFPGGTITGCPKIRSMEIIAELEKRPRGFYTGSMGFVAPGPSFDLNILIRSFTLFDDGNLEFFAGAGIVADSDPEKEYLETLYKVEALAGALGTSLLRPS